MKLPLPPTGWSARGGASAARGGDVDPPGAPDGGAAALAHRLGRGAAAAEAADLRVPRGVLQESIRDEGRGCGDEPLAGG